MKPAPSTPPPPLVVLRQRWVLVLPNGESYDAGYSYHRTAADRVRFVAARLGESERQGDAGREEPLGDAELFQVSPEQFKQVAESPDGSLRSR